MARIIASLLSSDRGMVGVDRPEGPPRADAHASSLGRDAAAADVRRPPAEPILSARAEPEAALPSVRAFREKDPLTTRVMDQLLLGVSTRGYAASLEVAPAG